MCVYLCDFSFLTARIWQDPGIVAAWGNANQTKVNLLLRRQLSINCCKSSFIESSLLIFPKNTFDKVSTVSSFWENIENKLSNPALGVTSLNYPEDWNFCELGSAFRLSKKPFVLARNANFVEIFLDYNVIMITSDPLWHSPQVGVQSS